MPINLAIKGAKGFRDRIRAFYMLGNQKGIILQFFPLTLTLGYIDGISR